MLWQGQIGNLGLSVGKIENSGFFRKSCDLKVGRCRQLIELRYKEVKIHEHDAGHMTRWQPSPYMVKTLQNLLRNSCTNFHEPVYVASGIPAHHIQMMTVG